MNQQPTCALILIGNELLSGRTPDANMNPVARRMAELGIDMREVRVIPDDQDEIISTVNTLRHRYSYVFTTGGIGPTHDDITTPCIAAALDLPVVRDEAVEKLFYERAKVPVTAEMLRMADFPEGARTLPSGASLAPGYMVENVIVMAGIPNVMRATLEAVVPYLQRGEEVHSQSVDAFIAESIVSKGFGEIQDQFPTLELGSYPFFTDNRAGTSLVIKGKDRIKVDKAVKMVKNLLDDLGAELL